MSKLKNLAKRRLLPALATSAAIVAGSLFGAGAAHADFPVYNPCDRLNAGQVKYPSYGANRITFATTPVRETAYAVITNCVRQGGGYVQEWQTAGTVGASGFKAPGIASGPTIFEYSPTGSFSFTMAFGLGNPGTALPYQTLNPGSRWNGHPWTAGYNQYFEENTSGATFPDENMWFFATRPQHDYRQGAVINYNREPDSPVVQNAGFAIFLHENPVPTAGCVALPEDMVNRFLQTAQPGDRIIMGADDDIFTPYSANLWGSIQGRYFQLGGQIGGLGQPTSNETGGLRNGGAYQNFQGGAILWSPNTGTHVTGGAIRSEWAATGFENGALGYPTSDEQGGLRAGGSYQNYEGGAILWSPATGAHSSRGAIRALWGATGFENGGLGYPTSDEVGGLKGGGVYQNFQNGAILAVPGAGVHLSVGSIRQAWASTGFEQGGLGYPTSDEYAIPGGVAQDYQGGIITATQAGGVRVVAGAIGAKYAANRALGYATSPATAIANGGIYQNFQNGSILWTPATGAHISVGGTRQAWQRSGFENGPLGYPTSDEVPAQGGGVYQSYQGGVIYWSPATAGHYILSDYNVKLAAVGGLTTLGYPTSDPVNGLRDGGTYQNFQNGALISSPATGIHTSTGKTRTAWAATGFEAGKLGYPTTDEYTNPDGSVAQDFQGGTITVGADGTVTVSTTPVTAPTPAPSPSPTPTPTPVPTETATPVPSPTDTATPSPTATATGTATASPTASPTATASPAATAAPTGR